MSTLSKEQVKQLVQGNNFQSVSDVNSYLKDIFKVSVKYNPSIITTPAVVSSCY